MDVADAPFLDVAHRALEVRARALLGAHLHDAIVAAGGVDHQPAVADVVRDRLLDVDVLAGVAGVDAHDRVPVLGRGDHDRVDVAVLEQPAVVGHRFGAATVRATARSIAGCDTSQTATMSTSGLPMNCRRFSVPKLPTPIMPMRTRSLGARRRSPAGCGACLAGTGYEVITGRQAAQHGRLEKISPLHSASSGPWSLPGRFSGQASSSVVTGCKGPGPAMKPA